MARQRVQVDITSATIFRIVLILVGVYVLYLVRHILLLLLGAFIFASAIEPVVEYLSKRGIPRIAGVFIVYVTVGIILFGLGTVLLQPVAMQAYQLAQVLPSAVNRISQTLPVVVPQVTNEALIEVAQNALFQFGDNVASVGANVFAGTRTVFSRAFTIVFLFVLTFYLAAEKDAVKNAARFLAPKEHSAYLDHAITRAQKSIGRWVLGILALGTSVGLLIGVGLWLLGVPYALLLGIVAGLMEILPLIGPITAGVIGVLVALSQSFTIALVALIWYVIVGLVESYVLIPNIMRRAVGIKPIVTVIAVVTGAQLGGIAGIILAVPIATLLGAFLSDIFKRSTT